MAAKKFSPPPFASFCGWPVRNPSVSEPQNGYNRALAISRMPPTYEGFARSRKKSVSAVFEYRSPSRFNMPRATSASRKSLALRGWSIRRSDSVSKSREPFASSVNRPISTALRSVFEPQKPRPSCRIPSGVACSLAGEPLGSSTLFSFPFPRRVISNKRNISEIRKEVYSGNTPADRRGPTLLQLAIGYQSQITKLPELRFHALLTIRRERRALRAGGGSLEDRKADRERRSGTATPPAIEQLSRNESTSAVRVRSSTLCFLPSQKNIVLLVAR